MKKPFLNDIDTYIRELIREQMGEGDADRPLPEKNGLRPEPGGIPQHPNETSVCGEAQIHKVEQAASVSDSPWK